MVYLMIGVSGSGKTTIGKKLSKILSVTMDGQHLLIQSLPFL